jgi:hypothetical protein
MPDSSLPHKSGSSVKATKGDAMVGSIICGVDNSGSAHGAARVARGLSSKLGLPLVFVRVVDEGSPDDEITATAERLERLSSAASELDCGARIARFVPGARRTQDGNRGEETWPTKL